MGKLVFGGLLRAMALVLATVGALLVLGSTCSTSRRCERT